MKRTIISLFSIFVILAMVVSCSSKDEEGAPSGMKSAHSANADYYLYVPSDWVVDTADNSLMVAAHVSDSDRTNVTVMAYTGDRTYESLEDYFDAYSKGFERMFDLDESENSTLKMITDGERCLLGGVAANNYVYSGTVGGVELKYRQVIGYWNGDYYLITFTADPELYDEHQDDFDKIVQNFTFVQKPTTTASLTDKPNTDE